MPVTSEDCKVYERAATEKWLGEHDTSPSTNKKMGKKLFPAPQARSTIEAPLKSGVVSEENVMREWGCILTACQLVASLLSHSYLFGLFSEGCSEEEEAQVRGDSQEIFSGSGGRKCLCMLGYARMHGEFGLKKDTKQARRWFKRWAELEIISCKVIYGVGSCTELEAMLMSDLGCTIPLRQLTCRT